MEIDISKCEHYDDGKCNCYYEEMNYEIFSKDSCVEHSDCYYKELQQVKAMIEKIKEHCNETIRVMGDTGNNPYAQGRAIEAKRVLEILGEDNGN